ncbi:MAG TPA: nuclease-related domain-containing protein [Ilumatobacteraceae bacterium]|nr:nuclease-related domain-containing protein [Ilumatobacteraceae bacterium]
MTQLIETRWTRYGKDRVYVKTADGDDVGHVDLVARTVVARVPDYEIELQMCLARWTSAADQLPDETPVPAPPAPVGDCVTTPEPTITEPSIVEAAARDLAGAAARAKRNEVNAQAPVMNFVARVLGVKTDERAWRVGAKGEEKVANELAKLDGGWRVLHAVEVGENGSDIDHVLIGPPGVFTLNTKRHPRGKAWVGDRMVMVNGQPTDYLRNSRFEANRSSRLLTAACARDVPVTAAIVFVDLDGFTVKQIPPDVHVTTCRRLLGWLRALPATIDATDVEVIFAKARLSSTWK